MCSNEPCLGDIGGGVESTSRQAVAWERIRGLPGNCTVCLQIDNNNLDHLDFEIKPSQYDPWLGPQDTMAKVFISLGGNYVVNACISRICKSMDTVISKFTPGYAHTVCIEFDIRHTFEQSLITHLQPDFTFTNRSAYYIWRKIPTPDRR